MASQISSKKSGSSRLDESIGAGGLVDGSKRISLSPTKGTVIEMLDVMENVVLTLSFGSSGRTAEKSKRTCCSPRS